MIMLRGDQLEVVSQFKYLGSIFTSDCTLDAEIRHRVFMCIPATQTGQYFALYGFDLVC